MLLDASYRACSGYIFDTILFMIGIPPEINYTGIVYTLVRLVFFEHFDGSYLVVLLVQNDYYEDIGASSRYRIFLTPPPMRSLTIIMRAALNTPRVSSGPRPWYKAFHPPRA